VFGRSDLLHSEIVAAAIVPAPNTDFAELKTRLLEMAKHHLAPYEVPTSIEQVAQIPRTPLGKVQKHLLRDAAGVAPSEDAAGQEKEVD